MLTRIKWTTATFASVFSLAWRSMLSASNFWFATGKIAGRDAGPRKNISNARRRWMRKKGPRKKSNPKSPVSMKELFPPVAAQTAPMKHLLVQKHRRKTRKSLEISKHLMRGAFLNSRNLDHLFLPSGYELNLLNIRCLWQFGPFTACHASWWGLAIFKNLIGRPIYPLPFFDPACRSRRTRSSAGTVDRNNGRDCILTSRSTLCYLFADVFVSIFAFVHFCVHLILYDFFFPNSFRALHIWRSWNWLSLACYCFFYLFFFSGRLEWYRRFWGYR